MGCIVYVLSSNITNKSYVGFTTNLKKRLEEHNSGKSLFTSQYRPWEVIYTERVKNEIQGRIREKYLKSASGRRLVLKKLFKDK